MNLLSWLGIRRRETPGVLRSSEPVKLGFNAIQEGVFSDEVASGASYFWVFRHNLPGMIGRISLDDQSYRLYGTASDFETVVRNASVNDTVYHMSLAGVKGFNLDINFGHFDIRRGLFLADGRIFVREDFFEERSPHHSYLEDVPMYLRCAKKAFGRKDYQDYFKAHCQDKFL